MKRSQKNKKRLEKKKVKGKKSALQKVVRQKLQKLYPFKFDVRDGGDGKNIYFKPSSKVVKGCNPVEVLSQEQMDELKLEYLADKKRIEKEVGLR